MSPPRLPRLNETEDPWGPPTEIPSFLRFEEVPYAPFSKGDKLGKVADWAADATKDGKDQKRQQYGRGHRDPYHAYGASAASSFLTEDAEDVASFSVVDSSTRPAPRGARTQTVLRARGGGRGGQNQAATPSRGRGGGGFTPRGGSQYNPRFTRWGSRRPGWRDYDKPQKDASVNITEDWKIVQTIGFNELQKLSFDVSKGSLVESYGYVHTYNKNLDKPQANVKLQQLDRIVYNVSTSEDPVIQELSTQNAGTVYATDSIIALLMTATKSVNPWDIIINKKDGKIFLDKREGGPLDFVTVDENAAEPPADATDKDNINSSANLAIEATYINQNFIVNAITESEKTQHKFNKENPFYTAEDQASEEPLLPFGYRYKSYNLADDPEGEPLNLVVRTQVSAATPSGLGGAQNLVTLQALNEYGGSNGTLEWKNKFVNQRGAIVAAEMKNNLSKLSRWTVQSILADAQQMKIGFVSRVNPKDNSSHIIVGVLGRNPDQFAGQLNLNILNGWGIVKSIVNIATALDDGKYVLIKDPNNPQVKLYSVPANTFEEDNE
ncbi:hypothetical protein TRVA0_006S03686 [Trichomonascus vanleenenianus]|uniref:eukaryotic translation initiation factor 3 subunit D n=1 Tax=Trichomonascus vanleenenianus TaxID=2268995 RepID=UPI003EC98DC6